MTLNSSEYFQPDSAGEGVTGDIGARVSDAHEDTGDSLLSREPIRPKNVVERIKDAPDMAAAAQAYFDGIKESPVRTVEFQLTLGEWLVQHGNPELGMQFGLLAGETKNTAEQSNAYRAQMDSVDRFRAGVHEMNGYIESLGRNADRISAAPQEMGVVVGRLENVIQSMRQFLEGFSQKIDSFRNRL